VRSAYGSVIGPGGGGSPEHLRWGACVLGRWARLRHGWIARDRRWWVRFRRGIWVWNRRPRPP